MTGNPTADTVHPAVAPIPPIRAPHRLLRVLAAVCMVGALVVAAPATSGAAPRPIGPLSPSSGAWFGATVNPDRGDGVGGGMGEIGARESFLGRRYDIINRFYAFDEAIPTSLESWDLSMGRIPMITWGAGADTIELRTGDPRCLARAQADRLAAFGEPIFLRYYHEMEAGYRSSEVHSPADMIAAWRHVHEIFASRGATNVVWVWCPTAWSFVTRSPWPPDYYPGDAYVDWIAADGYNWYPRPGSQWRSFTQVFDPFYDWASTKTKPIMIAENGVMEDPAQAARKAAWITSSRDLLPSAYPMIEAILYFDTQMTRNGFTHTWPVDTSQNAYNAYRAMGQDPYFNPPHGPGGGVIFADGFGAGSLSSWTTTTRFTIDDATGNPSPPSARAQVTNQSAWAARALGSTHSAVCMGVRVNVAARSGSLVLFRLRTAADGAIVRVFLNPSGQLAFRSDVSGVQRSSGVALGSGWHQVRLCGTVGGAGSWTLSRDGTPVLAGWTANTGTTAVGRVDIGSSSAKTFTANFDDVLVERLP